MPAVIGLAIAGFAVHLFFNGRYGYFRDEFDYIICGRHLAWGYVDHPPLLPFLSRICIAIFGESLRSVRLIPALSSGALVFLTGMIARELGGRRFALVLSAISVLIAPIYLSGGSLLTTNCDLEVLLWMGCAYFAIVAVQNRMPRGWLFFGLLAGIAFQEKYSIAIFCFSVVAGLLMTAQRRQLLNTWMLMGGVGAFLIVLPNLVWNQLYDWPFLQLMHNIRASGRDVVLSPWQYFSQQILLLSPGSALLWITGVAAFFTARRFQSLRFLGWAYIITFTLFVLLKGKNYYLAPIYPVYLCAGSIIIDDAISRIHHTWLRPVLLLFCFAIGAVLAPLTMPILPIDKFVSYMRMLPISAPRSEHSHERAILPQHYADQFGWNEIVAKTAEVWRSIPEGERNDCGIVAQDYGQAGSVDFLGPRYGLPPVLSGHQTWWIWGPRGHSGNCLVIMDDDPENLNALFEHVVYLGASAPNPYALESKLPFYLCRGPKFGTLTDLWPKLKHWR